LRSINKLDGKWVNSTRRMESNAFLCIITIRIECHAGNSQC
jgi:hypothetical protein